MAHFLVPPTVSVPTTLKNTAHLLPRAEEHHQQLYSKRAILYGLSTIAIGTLVSPDNASAAKRRPPPPPPEEKKDPNVSGLKAKLLANKKRKEAMKETVAKLRESGKATQ